jgi:hypothetical protein
MQSNLLECRDSFPSGMRNGTPPERPEFLDHPSDRVRARQAQIERFKVKLERTYHSWLTSRSLELKEMFEAKMGEYEERIEQLERLNRATTGGDE